MDHGRAWHLEAAGLTVRPEGLAALSHVSARIGADPDQVQGGGGNSSLKADGVLWIKASGTWLAHAEAQEIFLPLDLARLRRQIGDGAEDPTTGCFDVDAGPRPSIETTLHGLLPHRVVVHTHSVNAIAWAVGPDAVEALGTMLAGLSWAWVPYRRPGLPLTQAVAAVLEGRLVCEVLVLANHGLVVGANSPGAAEALLANVEQRLAIPPRTAPAWLRSGLDRLVEIGDWRLPSDPLVHAVATDPDAYACAQGGALYPDHVVFLDAFLPYLEDDETVAAACRRHEAGAGRAPVYLAKRGAGVLLSTAITAGAEEMLRCLARVLLRLPPGAPVRYLSAADVAALVDWESERYRQALDAGSAGSAPVDTGNP